MTLGVLTALSMMTGPALSAEADDDGAMRCIDLRRIDHTQVVDNQNILFYMRGDTIYLNRLSHPAPGLDRNQPFMYKTSLGQLCNSDFITVLERWGFGLTEGASSSLGKFMAIDEARAQALISGEPSGVEAEPVD
jgi:hypothetical protein